MTQSAIYKKCMSAAILQKLTTLFFRPEFLLFPEMKNKTGFSEKASDEKQHSV